ncbi:SpaA isopeptide-forming pilin-related protein [uncultured Dubosiella sp.]|uniref:SpaA isopeptide-forming pilin-related protein n=4 Tax=uncultured Dubosiella sp. TaxID=1937011 RepID=UPI0025971193|nr:SpaA isopeptide-forming pilin-related protein [uncultured Dubosiella sp.]
MKTLKKMSALLVALVMTMFTVVPAFAEEITSAPKDPTSKIFADIKDHELVAYQIFKGDAIREDVTTGEGETAKTENTGVLSNIEWGNGINSSAFITDLNTAFPAWGLTASSTAADVANKFNGLSVEDANKVAQIAFDNKTGTPISLTNPGKTTVRQGYYLIVDTTKKVESGDSLNPAILAVNGNVTVKEKKDKVTVDKTVKNETDTDFAEATDSSIGKKVTFKLHTKVIDEVALANYESYFLQFSDTASNALDPVVDADKKVVFKAYLSEDDTLVTEGENADEDITNWFTASIVTGTGTADRTFTFTDENIKNSKAEDPNYAAGKHIFITYEATLNNNAVIGSTGNPNKVVVNYSNNPNWDGEGTPPTGTTPEDKAIVFSFELDGTKAAKEDSSTTLTGAEFVVYRMNNNNQKEYAVMDTNKKITDWEVLTDEDLNGKIADKATDRDKYLLISDEKGAFGIQGLGDGTYFLQETKAPAGYNLITSPIEFEITSTQENKELKSVSIKIGEKTVNGTVSTGTVNTTVENTKGTTLPETGGMGTTMLYVAGGILLVGSAVLLVTKKRMGHEG